jgi:amino acid transporter
MASGDNVKQPGLWSAIFIGVGCMIGSGWLFAAYYGAKYAGPSVYISWVIGAVMALVLSFLLAEVATMYKGRGLFARLLNISHNNPDMGFIVAVSGWLGLVVVIPSEASATVQYLSSAIPSLKDYVFQGQQLTWLGTVIVVIIMLIYGLINFWGVKSLAKANNTIGVFKLAIPVLTALILMVAAFHPENFYSQGFAPRGIEHSFGAVVECGIFYAFYGFAMVAIFGSELKNPEKNIPLSLVLSVAIALVVYLFLQTAFIGALPTSMVGQGFGNLNFESPLAQLLLLLNINLLAIWAIVLYIDAAISPSGTGMVYAGSASRILTGMAQDKQLPQFFAKMHPVYELSRRSLVFTVLICCAIVIFFRSWREIMVVVTVLQLISCMAIPLSFTKLRLNEPETRRPFRVKFGHILSYLIYLVVTFLLISATVFALVFGFILHVAFFLFYAFTYYRASPARIVRAFLSCWTIFLYIALGIVFGYFYHHQFDPYWVFPAYAIAFTINFILMLKQKNYNSDINTQKNHDEEPYYV